MTEDKQKSLLDRDEGEVDLVALGQTINQLPEDFEGEIDIPLLAEAYPVSTEALSSALEGKKGHYKSSLHLERQLFGDIQEKAEQMFLFTQESPEIARQKASQVTGLDWTLTEQVAFHGLSKLLAKTDYRGHLSQRRDTIFGADQTATGIVTTWPEIFEACGLPRNKAGWYAGRYVDDLKKAVLESLPRPRNIFVKQKIKKGKETRYNVFQGEIKLIDVIKDYRDLREEEASQVEQGKSLPNKVNRLLVLFHPLALREIESFYSLIPFSLYQDIKKVLPGYKGRIVPLFLRWLLSTDLQEINIKRETLAKILRIDYLINPKESKQSRHGPQKKRLKEELTKCFVVAKKLGFLLDFREKEGGAFYFLKGNPKNLPRLEKKLRDQESKLRLIEAKHEKDSSQPL